MYIINTKNNNYYDIFYLFIFSQGFQNYSNSDSFQYFFMHINVSLTNLKI